MSKRRPKAATQVDIDPWLSANADNREGRFIQVGNSFLLSKHYQSLSLSARCMYICMTMESGGKRKFEFPKSAGKKFGFPYTSYTRNLKELLDNQFIKCTQKNGNLRKANVYEFCMDWKIDSS